MSIRRHVDPAALYGEALTQVRALTLQGAAPLPLPEKVIFPAAEFRSSGMGARLMLERIRAAQAPLLPGGEGQG